MAAQRPLALNFDANVKCNHYKSCGESTTAAYEKANLLPQLSMYFGPAGEVAAKLQQGEDACQPDPGSEAGVALVFSCGLCVVLLGCGVV